MKRWILLIILLTSCASLNENEKMLMDAYLADVGLIDLGIAKNQYAQTKSNIVTIWRHGTSLPHGDFFWGGWISIVIDKPHWVETP